MVICADRQSTYMSCPASSLTEFLHLLHVQVTFISLNVLTSFSCFACAHVVTVASNAFPHILPVETLLLSHFTLHVSARTDLGPTCVVVTCVCVFLSHHTLSLLKVGLFFYSALYLMHLLGSSTHLLQ